MTQSIDQALDEAVQPAMLHRLEQRRLRIRRGATHVPGNNPVARATQASGLELAKHRAYTIGDDLRYLDWNAMARHDQLMVREFCAERQAPLHVLIDCSASMGVPASDHKLATAVAIAAALSYVSLRQRDPVCVAALGEHPPAQVLTPPLHHPERLPLLQRAMSHLRPHGAIRLRDSVASYLRTTRTSGIAIVLSDFLAPQDDREDALQQLRSGGYDTVAIRLLGARERQPSPATPRIRVRDCESGQERLIHWDTANRERYSRALESHTHTLRSWCERNSTRFALADTSASIEHILFDTMARTGVLH